MREIERGDRHRLRVSERKRTDRHIDSVTDSGRKGKRRERQKSLSNYFSYV